MIETKCRFLEMPLKDDQEAETIIVKNEEIHENDVLMGRGGKNNRHVGNERLREIAREKVEKYKVSTKKIKSAISRDIVKHVRGLDPPGRFLRRIAETGEWEDVGDYLAREKVAQVLRDAVCEAAEATTTNEPPLFVASVSPYGLYPDGRASGGVFRHNPDSGMAPGAQGNGPGSSPIPGVVTASSGSGSFGVPIPYTIPPQWFAYGQPPKPPHPSFPGMPRFPPGYRPTHPRFVATSTEPYATYMPRHTIATAVPAQAAQFTEVAAQSQPPSPGNDRTTTSYPSSYSISLSVASAPGTGPVTARTEAYMSWNPSTFTMPAQSTVGRKRSRSLQTETPEKPLPPSSPHEDVTLKFKSPSKKNSATQTPPIFDEPGLGAGVAMWSTPLVPQIQPHPFPHPRPAMLYPRGQRLPQELVYGGHPGQHSYDQPAFETHPQPPTRSFSEPLPVHAMLEHAEDAKDGDSSVHSMIERCARETLSTGKVPERVNHQNDDDLVTPLPLHERLNAILEPSQVPLVHGNVHIEPLAALPCVRRLSINASAEPPQTISRERQAPGSTRHGRTARGVQPAPDEAMDWFQGQLLLESDEDDSDHGNDKDQYPV